MINEIRFPDPSSGLTSRKPAGKVGEEATPDNPWANLESTFSLGSTPAAAPGKTDLSSSAGKADPAPSIDPQLNLEQTQERSYILPVSGNGLGQRLVIDRAERKAHLHTYAEGAEQEITVDLESLAVLENRFSA